MTGEQLIPNTILILFISIPIVVTIYMFWLCWTRGEDSSRKSVTVQYEPPEKLSPAECGTLLDNAVAVRSVTATITDLSVRGYLSIEQHDTGTQPEIHRDYLFKLTKADSQWVDLKPHEQILIKSIFRPTNPLLMVSEAMERLQHATHNAAVAEMAALAETRGKEAYERYHDMGGPADSLRPSVTFSELQNQFALHLGMIRGAVFDRLVADGYYSRRPDQIRMVYGVSGFFIGVLTAAAGVVLAGITHTAFLPLILAGLLTGAVILGFGRYLPARTNTGVDTLSKVMGFQDFLTRVEKDHIERLEKTPELFEKYLPYAMALGVENNWTKSFANITLPPPKWYKAPPGGGFLPLGFVSDLHDASSQPTREVSRAEMIAAMRTASPG